MKAYMLLKTLRTLDWLTTLCIIAIMCVSLICMYSSTAPSHAYAMWYKHVWGMVIGIGIYMICSYIPFHHLWILGTYGFYITTGLLLLTIISGSVGMGAQRWVQIAGIRFQPAEIMKLVMPFFIVAHLSRHEDMCIHRNIRHFMPLICILVAACFLVLRQPDLGSAVILCTSGSLLLWVAGLPHRFFVYVAITGALIAPIAWNCIKPYQRERIRVFLGSGSSHKERYHLEQSHIAIGSGGFFGKGWQQGTQNQLRFLPERRTDFIFSVLCEEFGFLGGLMLIILYIMLFSRIISCMHMITSLYPKLLILGLMLPHALSVIINIGMVMGLLPIVGIPLPFVSYGLSHLWTTCASFGSINSIIDKWMYR